MRHRVGMKGTNAELREEARVKRLKRHLAEWEALAAEGPIFWPGYLKEIRPNAYPLPKKRVSADEKRAPRTSRTRGTR